MYSLPTRTLVGWPPTWLVQGHRLNFSTNFLMEKGWLAAREQQHIMYISYEEMILDLEASMTRMAQFLDTPLDSEMIRKITDRCVFKNMKKNKMSNYSLVPSTMMDQNVSEFLRKGIAGDWKNHLTVAEAEHFDEFYQKKMQDVKYNFFWD
ncbi:unnamed protein product [Arctogadus glacialis]